MSFLAEVFFWAGIFSLSYIFQWLFRAKLAARKPSLSRHRSTDNKRRKWGDPVEITTTSGIKITTHKKAPDDYHFYMDPDEEERKQTFLASLHEDEIERIVIQ